MTYQWQTYPDAVSAAQALAQAVANALQHTLAQQDHAVLAVSGGRSPIAFFEALSQIELDWAKVSITLVDERIVSVQHPDSNTGLVRKYLLCNQAAAATWIPMVSIEADEATLANNEQAVAFALQHYRQPDVLVLGMGNDGHTASLFPQAPQFADGVAADYPQPLLHTTPITASHERISMSLKAIEQAAYVYLAIGGAEKQAIFEQAAIAVNPQLPISYVLHSEKVVCHVYFAN